jgi:hypothetical protein
MNNTAAVIAVIVILLVAAAGLALHPSSPLTIIYLFPDDLYHGWIRLFYPRDDNHGRRFPYPKPQPSPEPRPEPNPLPPNGYNPALPPRFPVQPPSSFTPSHNIPARFPADSNGYTPIHPNPSPPNPSFNPSRPYPVNPNGNIPVTPNPNPSPLRPSYPPTIQPIEPNHSIDLHPLA